MQSTDFQQSCKGEMIIFTRSGGGTIEHRHAKKQKRKEKEHGDLTSLIKIKSKPIIDLYVKCKTKTSRTK